MRTLETSGTADALPEGQRAALISLLADEDPAVYHLIRTKLLSYGPEACEWLRPQMLSSDPRMRRRALEILGHHRRGLNDEAFLNYCRHHGEDIGLEESLGLLAQTRYPEVNREGYAALFDTWAAELRERLKPGGLAEHTLGIINRFVFTELGFHPAAQPECDPDASYLNLIVDRRSGNPIGLCSIYLLLMRRLRLPVTGIGLPGHFVCRYQSTTQEIYIDCYHGGAFLTKGDCVKHLLRKRSGLGEGYLAPVTSRQMLLRVCNNLVMAYGHLELTEEVARVRRYAKLLAR